MLRTSSLIKIFELRVSLSTKHFLILKTGTIFLPAMMKGSMMVFAPLCLLLCWMLPVDSRKIPQDANSPIPLTMAKYSVDDNYFGCETEMAEKVYKKYFKEEKAWETRNSAIHLLCKKIRKKNHKGPLTKDHIQAICVYTGDSVQKEFNVAVRTEKDNYGSSFKFHTLHFLLTTAIQILRTNSKKQCYCTYRRTNVEFTGDINQTFRFGSFASSSLKPNLKKHFGNKTCFKIKTCYGADITKYSLIAEEEEVLIPPYEKFKITSKTTKGRSTIKGLKDCEIVYEVESEGQKSNLWCKLCE